MPLSVGGGAILVDLTLRMSVSSCANNLFTFRFRGNDTLTHYGVTTLTWTDRLLPRGVWTDWTVEFFTSDPGPRLPFA